uniref:Solute carrier family 47 member 3 n=1 Tax=Echeneis naucrates TaxID=173247 RepID=A0A665TK02_ECHNA
MESRTQSSPVSSWRDCFLWKGIRMLAPIGYKTEIKELSKLAGPIISQAMVFSVSLVSTIFCGHLGKTALAGVTLAIATFGSRNFLKVGVILQRAVLILTLACFPCWAILINTEPILLAFRQEPEVARLAQMYVKVFMPALPGIIWPQVITGVVVNLLNALINYIVLHVVNMGVIGSALANTISQFAMVGLLYVYIMWQGLHKATWGGWSKECLQDWGPFLRLAIPGMVMMCVEWWTYEIGGFLAGLISEVEIGTQAIVYELANVAYVFPLGFSVAGSVRVGNALGAGETELAKLSAKMSMILSICSSVLIGSLKDYISYIFTYDDGIIQGAGKQTVGAICNILGYYGIGFPVGVPLMFVAKLGIKGKAHSRSAFCTPSHRCYLIS